MISRDAIRKAVDVQRIVDRLCDSAGPIDAHPLQIDGEAIQWLEDILSWMVRKWVRQRGVKIE